MEWIDIPRCPRTGGTLRPDETGTIVRVENTNIVYPVRDGVIDFCPESKDRITASYDRAAAR